MEKNAKILITGGSGLVGSALTKYLAGSGFTNVVSLGSRDCDLTDRQMTEAFFLAQKPDYVFHLAARVYGIMGNMSNKGKSYLDNVLINTHVVEATRLAGAKKIVAMGSGCVYPYPSPGGPLDDLKEETIFDGRPHHSEDSYAHSKRAMYVQLLAYKENYGLPFAFAISGNLYGPGDKFDAEFGHVTPALVRKFYEAKRDGTSVSVWGDGSARRDFTYSEDAGRALAVIMEKVEGAVNLGSGHIHRIREIVEILTDEAGMQGRVVWDSSKPNGQEYRAYNLDALRNVGFVPSTNLEEGIRLTYRWYSQHAETARK